MKQYQIEFNIYLSVVNVNSVSEYTSLLQAYTVHHNTWIANGSQICICAHCKLTLKKKHGTQRLEVKTVNTSGKRRYICCQVTAYIPLQLLSKSWHFHWEYCQVHLNLLFTVPGEFRSTAPRFGTGQNNAHKQTHLILREEPKLRTSDKTRFEKTWQIHPQIQLKGLFCVCCGKVAHWNKQIKK